MASSSSSCSCPSSSRIWLRCGDCQFAVTYSICAPAKRECSALSLKAAAGGSAAVVWAVDERDAWRETHAAMLETQTGEREAAEAARGGTRDEMDARSAEIIEATKAERAKKAEAYAAFLAEREALLTRLLPEPPAPPEPVDDKKKGKKK